MLTGDMIHTILRFWAENGWLQSQRYSSGHRDKSRSHLRRRRRNMPLASYGGLHMPMDGRTK